MHLNVRKRLESGDEVHTHGTEVQEPIAAEEGKEVERRGTSETWASRKRKQLLEAQQAYMRWNAQQNKGHPGSIFNTRSNKDRVGSAPYSGNHLSSTRLLRT